MPQAQKIVYDKGEAVAELTTRFRESTAAVLTEYRGLSTSDLTTLRRSLGTDTAYTVVKNTLTRRAAVEAGYGDLQDLLVGPTAIAFAGGDPVEVAKGLRDFARTNPALVIKGGIMDGRPLSAEEFARIADLESREVLLAKLAGALKAGLSQAAALFQAPIAQVARLAAALEEKLQADAPAETPADAPAETPADATPDDTTE